MSELSLTSNRKSYRQALDQTLKHIVVALARRPEVKRAILFGSYADGRADLFTDLDILIVMDSPLDFVTRTAEMYRDLAGTVDMDLLVYTPEELERHQGRGFIRQILETGKVIYEQQVDGG